MDDLAKVPEIEMDEEDVKMNRDRMEEEYGLNEVDYDKGRYSEEEQEDDDLYIEDISRDGFMAFMTSFDVGLFHKIIRETFAKKAATGSSNANSSQQK